MLSSPTTATNTNTPTVQPASAKAKPQDGAPGALNISAAEFVPGVLGSCVCARLLLCLQVTWLIDT
jgi:hypothetical protein